MFLNELFYFNTLHPAAEKYSEQAVRLVAPPKTRLKITAIGNNIIIPKSLKDKSIITVDSVEWNKMLENTIIKQQLESEQKNLTTHIELVDIKLREEKLLTESLIKKTAQYEKDIIEKRGTIFKLYTALTTLVVLIVAGIWARMKGIL